MPDHLDRVHVGGLPNVALPYQAPSYAQALAWVVVAVGVRDALKSIAGARSGLAGLLEVGKLPSAVERWVVGLTGFAGW
jgi:hypothetical protein